MPAIVSYALLTVPLIGAYALFAVGISVIYRASRVLNLAHGAMAMLPAYLAYSANRAGLPIGLCVLVAAVGGAGLGVGVERVFVRRLRQQGPTAQTVGTVAVTGLLIAVASKVWGTAPLRAPRVFPDGVLAIGSTGVSFGEIGLFVSGLAAAGGLFLLFKYTQVGLAMRGSAQNRRAASLMGIDPDIAASAAWALGGGLAGLAGVMLAGVTNLDPYTLSLQVLPAFVAALIGGLESLPGAVGGAGIAGLSFGLVPYFSQTPVIGEVARMSGAPQLVLAILTLVVMAVRGRRISGAQDSDGGFSASPVAPRKIKPKNFGLLMALVAVALMVWPWVVAFSVLGTSLLAIVLSLVAISLVVLTGWVGQISLAQASFVGISAFMTGLISRGLGIGFPLSLLVSAAVAAAAAAGLGVIALRVRGLYLAVATLIFAWMCDQFLFKMPLLGAAGGSSTIPPQRLGDPRGIPYFDLGSRRTLFYVAASILLVTVFLLANLRDARTGRAFFAIRGSEVAAASLGIDVVRYKLAAFAISGALAGMAGNLLMIDQRTVVPGQFQFTISLQFLAVAVVGGLGSLGGGIAAGVLFAALNELFFRVPILSGWLEVVSALLLTGVLLLYPGGLADLPGAIGRRLRWMQPIAAPISGRLVAASYLLTSTAKRLGGRILVFVGVRLAGLKRQPRTAVERSGWFDLVEVRHDEIEDLDVAPKTVIANLKPRSVKGSLDPVGVERDSRAALIEASDVTVKFGGLVAVNRAGLVVRESEIVGLIGPNGAGKTTLFNAILGLNDPSEGEIRLYGTDVSSLAPHQRAALGVARTFQVLQLFSELTVFDNLLVATHLHDRTSVFSNMAAGPRTLAAEAAARQRVASIIDLLGLQDVSQKSVRGLPFGTLRTVELGRALVTGAKAVMLDEPASGLNDAETDRLSELILQVRGLGVSVLLIEHDVRMVSGVCDYVYVLDRGTPIAEGTPATIRRDPAVIAAYLGRSSEEIGV